MDSIKSIAVGLPEIWRSLLYHPLWKARKSYRIIELVQPSPVLNTFFCSTSWGIF